jgi:hypothetical protein
MSTNSLGDEYDLSAYEESKGNQFGYKCPKCGSDEHLSIQITTWTNLFPDGCDSGGDSEWEHNSQAVCGNHNCDWSGVVRDLRGDDE